MRHQIFILFLILLSSGCAKKVTQGIAKKEVQIDSLFQQYTDANLPGYAMGIIQDGKLVYSKGYGYANLEHKIPLTDSSAVYIGSMAKQFTTAALLILEAQGQVDLGKPVKAYLPEFPTYQEPITINHLIHHTSGIRETNSMQLFQGIDTKFEEVFDTNDLYNLILKQEELNFLPGQEFRYSSGGYAVLAKIVERISGKSFRAFTKEHIFDRLGMSNTVVSDNHNEIIRNRADSYWPNSEGKLERRSHVFDAYGDGGIITTVADLAKWDKAFYKDLLGVDNFAEKMYQKGKLNNGEAIEYARALEIRNYKGLKMITHNGGMLGFVVDMVRFPEVKTSFILLGNSRNLYPTGDILRISNLWLAEHLSSEKNKQSGEKRNQEKEVRIPREKLSDYEGYYWTDESNYFRRISIRKDSLFFDSGDSKYAQYLTPIGQNEFLLHDDYMPARLIFQPSKKGEELKANFSSMKRSFRKFDPAIPKDLSELQAYIGKYYSDELSTTYEIFQESEKLYLKINDNKPTQIFPVLQNGNVVWNGKKMLWIGFGEVKFDFDQSNRVTGLTIGDGRVSGIKFVKNKP